MFDSFASQSRYDSIGRWFDRLSGRDKWIESEGRVTKNLWRPPCEGLDGYYRVNYSYEVAGEWFSGWFNADDAQPLGDLVMIRYNPRNPKRKYRSGFRGGREPLVLIAVGIGATLFYFAWYMVKQTTHVVR